MIEDQGSQTTSVALASGARVVWVDVAKGVAILLVVFHHVVLFAAASGYGSRLLEAGNGALMTFRMPLFFLVAGLYFAGNLAKPWRTVLRTKVLVMVWLYVVWSIARAVYFTVVPWIIADGREPLGDLPRLFTAPSTGMWFLYALALYFFAVRVGTTLRVPPQAQVLVAIVLSVLVSVDMLHLPMWTLESMARYFFFFVLAVHGRVAIMAAVDRARWSWVWVGFLIWLGMVWFQQVSELRSWATVPASIVAVASGLALSVCIERCGRGRHLAWLGRRTLSVYVLHVFVVAAFYAVVPDGLGVLTNSAAAVGLALILTVVVAFVSAAAEDQLRRVPGVLTAPWSTRAPDVLSPKW